MGEDTPKPDLQEQKKGEASKMFPSREEVAAVDERQASQTLGTTPICEIEERQRVRVSGILQALTFVPMAQSPSLRGQLYDGTGFISLIWTGRRDIPGINVGVHLVANGVVVADRIHGLTIMNPDYSIVARKDADG
ncbi:MAG: nucleotide-binding protein [Actinomycetaceae bacterium]|nr:nucleotide-binding protein [Actinomycetaceae bacterium]